MYQVEAVVRASFSRQLIAELRSMVSEDSEVIVTSAAITNLPGSPFFKKSSVFPDSSYAEWDLSCEKISVNLSPEGKEAVIDSLKFHRESVIDITSKKLEVVIDIVSGAVRRVGKTQKGSHFELSQ